MYISSFLTIEMKYDLIECAKFSQIGLNMTCKLIWFLDLDDNAFII